MERRLMILVSALMLFVASSEPLCAQWSMLDGDPVWVYRQSVNATIKNAPKEVRQFNVEPLLFSVEEGNPNYTEAIRLLNLLKNVLPVPTDVVPKDSLLREFIGGGYFN